MKLRNALIGALSAITLAGGATAAFAASSASAAPPPPVTIHTTSVQTSDTHLGPKVQVLRFAEYQPQAKTPGFTETATILEVCVNVPHIVPPVATTTLAECTWRLTTTGPAPHSTLTGTATLNGLGQIGRVTAGTHLYAGAHSLPGSFLAVDLAPKTQADTFTFSL